MYSGIYSWQKVPLFMTSGSGGMYFARVAIRVSERHMVAKTREHGCDLKASVSDGQSC